MNILILGATGKTGRHVLAQALAAGHSVTAFVRDSTKLTPSQQLNVIVGDAQNSAQVREAVIGHDAVISALGHTSLTTSSALTNATRGAIEALPANAKFISLTGYGVADPHDPKPSLAGSILTGVIKLVPGEMFADGARHVDLLRKSTLSWTVIRAAVLTPGKATGETELGYFKLSPKDTISNADVAAAMVACLTDNTWAKCAPMIRRA